MEAHSPPIERSIFTYSVAPWITAFNVITVATNVLATRTFQYSLLYRSVLNIYSMYRIQHMAHKQSGNPFY